MQLLVNITDQHAEQAAQIARIKGPYEFERAGGTDNGSITIKGKYKGGDRSLKIYFNGSNTKCLHNGYEVIEYCFSIYDYLRSVGYIVERNKK